MDRKEGSMESEEKFINILRENLLFLKHQETQRMWAANIFIAIVVGASAYLGKEGLSHLPLAVPVVFLVISLLCLLITLKVNYVFGRTQAAIKKIFDDKKIYLEDLDWRKYVLPLDSKGWWWNHVKVRHLYAALYVLAVAASTYLLVLVLVS
jgi:hypothetical protein